MSASVTTAGGAELASINVLVVDEHPGMRMVWFALLHGFGIRKVSQLDRLDTLVADIRERKIDILIIDARVNGASTARTIRKLRMIPEDPIRFLPIIACTASTNPSIIMGLVEAGVDEILKKPVTIKEAARKMDAVINHRRPFVVTPGYFGPASRKPQTAALETPAPTVEQAKASGLSVDAPDIAKMRRLVSERKRKQAEQALKS